MDAVALLQRAQEVGLRIEPMGKKLLVRGPKRAEAVVKLLAEHKAEVLAALSLSFVDASWWRERFKTKAVQWTIGDRNGEAAKRLAWGDLENEWHHQHGKRWPTWQCAGCDAPISGLQALNLPDGNRVHFEPIDCLIRFGKRWRGAACEALVAFGLEPPGLVGSAMTEVARALCRRTHCAVTASVGRCARTSTRPTTRPTGISTSNATAACRPGAADLARRAPTPMRARAQRRRCWPRCAGEGQGQTQASEH